MALIPNRRKTSVFSCKNKKKILIQKIRSWDVERKFQLQDTHSIPHTNESKAASPSTHYQDVWRERAAPQISLPFNFCPSLTPASPLLFSV